ncbi:MAG: hypothetical protein MRY83_14445 [Flavobacteriales bacterium]|nr:hypothetical protein [Flavobacteriales bacterium]
MHKGLTFVFFLCIGFIGHSQEWQWKGTYWSLDKTTNEDVALEDQLYGMKKLTLEQEKKRSFHYKYEVRINSTRNQVGPIEYREVIKDPTVSIVSTESANGTFLYDTGVLRVEWQNFSFQDSLRLVFKIKSKKRIDVESFDPGYLKWIEIPAKSKVVKVTSIEFIDYKKGVKLIPN